MNRLNAFKFVSLNNLKIGLSFLCCIPLISMAQPQETELSKIQTCHYLQTVEGGSGYGKNVNWQVLAKYSALSKAEKLGASHLVWERFDPIGTFNGVAVAKIYDCNS